MNKSEFKTEFKNALWGSIEIPLFLKKGVSRFTPHLSGLFISVLVPLLVIPIYLILLPAEEGLEEKSFIFRLSILTCSTLISSILYLSCIYFLKNYNTSKLEFIEFVTAFNWLSLSNLLIQIPFLLLGIVGVSSWDIIYDMLILTIFYSCAYLTFLIFHLLKTNWAVSFAFAIIAVITSEVVNYFISIVIQSS